ncbi:hypothetical protein, partial [Priestia megaterium]
VTYQQKKPSKSSQLLEGFFTDMKQLKLVHMQDCRPHKFQLRHLKSPLDLSLTSEIEFCRSYSYISNVRK